jgi:hypothetical protein
MQFPRRFFLVAIGLAAALAGSGCGQLSGSESPDPSPASNPVTMSKLTPSTARRVVSSLWAARETVLSALHASQLPPVESGAAQAADAAYIRGALCHCEPRKSGHALVAVVPMIPRGSNGSFIAQVRTTNSLNEHPWYLIGVTPDHGQWKIGLVTFGGYQATPPLHRLTTAAGYTPSVTRADTKRMARLVVAGVRDVNRHEDHSSRTDYGATLTIHDTLRPSDGLFGLRLGSGKEFVCYTVHQIGDYTLAQGLAQNDDRRQWGALLAPGAYSSVAVDRAESVCVVGSGTTNKAGALWVKYDTQVVGTTGTPIGS